MQSSSKNLTDEEIRPPMDFFDLKIEEAESLIGNLAGKKYHGSSFVSYVYKHGYHSIDSMLSLPKQVRESLKSSIRLSPLQVLRKLRSKDGTVKFLFEVETPQGPQEIESVYIPDENRVTLCVSSQVGCKMGCQFCLTAQMGFKYSLPVRDIIRQVYSVSIDPELRPITNIVFMGMGEPLDNFDSVRKATRILTHVRGYYLSARKITVSTVGVVEKIDQIQKEDPFRLAVSLNASNDLVRSQLMPINRRWNMERLLKACHDYSRRVNKEVNFEYILMAGLTDRDEDAKRLIRLLSPLSCKINLIPYNESLFTEFKRPPESRVYEFQNKFIEAKIPVFIRKNRGNDIYAACGMLRRIQPETLQVR